MRRRKTVTSWVWVESKNAMAAAQGAFDATLREDGVYVMRGKFPETERTAVRISAMNFGTTWAAESSARVVEQSFVERTVSPPKSLVVVVDGSDCMRARAWWCSPRLRGRR